MGKTNHKAIKVEFNKRFRSMKLDFETERREVFNQLSDARAKARYLEGRINIDKEDLLSILKVIERMFIELRHRTRFDHANRLSR